MDLGRFKLIELSDRYSDKVWNEVQKWNRFDQDTIGKQLVRAADSISANLSEAFGRYSYADRKRFCYIARGSLCEVKNWIEKSIRRGKLDELNGVQLISDLDFISLKLNAYIRSLKRP